MDVQYLFPQRYKKWGWFLLLLGVIPGIYWIAGHEPGFLDVTLRVPLSIDYFHTKILFFHKIKDNLLNEIAGVLILSGLILIAFSKTADEDEFIMRIRLESLIWAVYLNYVVVLAALLLTYGVAFLWVMLFNLFTVLLLFIIKFYYELFRLRKSTHNEE